MVLGRDVPYPVKDIELSERLMKRNSSVQESSGSGEGVDKQISAPQGEKRRPNRIRRKSFSFPEPNMVLGRDVRYSLKDIELSERLKKRNSSVDLSNYLIHGAKKNDTISIYQNRIRGENESMVKDILADLIRNLNFAGDTPEDLEDIDVSARIGTLHPKKAKKPSKMRRIGAALRRVGRSLICPFTSCLKSS
ncbi:hypothetical protein LOTGIDRAFT_176490 [Lottia gigantea]|uniref:Uncharacterized protein n=1 Tax=Lottia gigantea TaxID=225164 RepID=V4A7E2_LOTGI|nr:hypothetical protein LOTGIDRAFT_176490 [Lottia gigantea]ESO99848.1 hypothetical protein LOTGIDRAFT_176490 [Lottia gigantea]